MIREGKKKRAGTGGQDSEEKKGKIPSLKRHQRG